MSSSSIRRPHKTYIYDIYYVFLCSIQARSRISWLSKDTLMKSVFFIPDCWNQLWQFGPACQAAVSRLPMWRTPMPQLSAALSHCTDNEATLAELSLTTAYYVSSPEQILITATLVRVSVTTWLMHRDIICPRIPAEICFFIWGWTRSYSVP